ncbi:DNA-binding protein [Haloferax volcanii]|uniref:DNA-binding protein n=2 Tax=Haloferax volcanii TaxID=2246 RepID=A0A6C0UYI3_HALVO|nr:MULTISPECIES: helix-turn-helix transcriptional regulator [Haloferax]ELZ76091.1 DNA binding domain-containing protein [Haloferax lucentense DSM 14919]NLV04073.1 DNA-binding protein [Haloferax alexandrinus]QIB79471.1 DNA-binding protein [Haloferax alexandrinus]
MSYNNLDTLLAFLREDLEPGQDRIYYSGTIANKTDLDGSEIGYWFARAVNAYPHFDPVEFDGLEVERYRPETNTCRWKVTRLADDVRLVADGGVRWLDLSEFQQQVVKAIIEIEQRGGEPYGLGIKELLSERYNKEVNHGRLYPNLDDLVEQGIIEKSELDKRTNAYESTASARAMVAGEAEHMASLAGLELAEAVTDGGEQQ